MATYSKCPNCGLTKSSAGRDLEVHECNSCGFKGCFGTGVFTHAGCWKTPFCPQCGKDAGTKRLGWIE